MAQHLGQVYVAADVLEVVEQLDVAQCLAIGLQVVEGNLQHLADETGRFSPDLKTNSSRSNVVI